MTIEFNGAKQSFLKFMEDTCKYQPFLYRSNQYFETRTQYRGAHGNLRYRRFALLGDWCKPVV